MPYVYEDQRSYVFTEHGQIQFLSIRDRAAELIAVAGAVRLDKIIAGETGDSWEMLACVDRLVEINELDEITPPGCIGQHRVFIRGRGR